MTDPKIETAARDLVSFSEQRYWWAIDCANYPKRDAEQQAIAAILRRHFQPAEVSVVKGRVPVVYEDAKHGGWLIMCRSGTRWMNRSGKWVFGIELFMEDRWPTHESAEQFLAQQSAAKG